MCSTLVPLRATPRCWSCLGHRCITCRGQCVRPISRSCAASTNCTGTIHSPAAGCCLNSENGGVGRRHVATLMKTMGIEALYRRPNTSRRHAAHRIYPYLLRNQVIERPNEVWAMDITYIPMSRGFVYLAAVLDWATRRVLSWSVSISMNTDFCIEAVEEALVKYGKPEIFNTDQGSQFTSAEFTDLLKQNDIAISMDGKGAWRDNVFVER